MYRENPEQADDRQYYDYHLDRNGSSLEAENEALRQPDVMCRFSSAIEEWIMTDINGDWYKDEENPNCFTDRKLGRALYVYKDCIKYWDDVRVHSDCCEYPIPNSKTALFDILGG